ncbi:uncharacterized protein J3D65DRAFT_47748 [Phyllosticta citribraziliensis]|uniref:Uncharacterized protein n=1 Tax=Phyllosticta citribraziliensis TaxID=989973 RepID=A0ABR1MB18_9PEZI
MVPRASFSTKRGSHLCRMHGSSFLSPSVMCVCLPFAPFLGGQFDHCATTHTANEMGRQWSVPRLCWPPCVVRISGGTVRAWPNSLIRFLFSGVCHFCFSFFCLPCLERLLVRGRDCRLYTRRVRRDDGVVA